ncbi:hypothetical protein BGZ58_007173 [Dissophora ornata]|nr:hypothetical protein BGZ58_007173 [Dissophora ornata]
MILEHLVAKWASFSCPWAGASESGVQGCRGQSTGHRDSKSQKYQGQYAACKFKSTALFIDFQVFADPARPQHGHKAHDPGGRQIVRVFNKLD